MKEAQLQRRGFIEGDGCEVQQMGLDSERVRAEGGTIAGVGDAAKDALGISGADAQLGDVDAVGRQ